MLFIRITISLMSSNNRLVFSAWASLTLAVSCLAISRSLRAAWVASCPSPITVARRMLFMTLPTLRAKAVRYADSGGVALLRGGLARHGGQQAQGSLCLNFRKYPNTATRVCGAVPGSKDSRG